MLAGRKLLLADDSITIQKVVALTFADEGVEVVTVGDGKEALEKLKEVTPDIVLADVLMPGANGYEICEYIKQNAKLKHIPVMLLVGSFEPFDEAEARRVGADDILTKPFQSIRRLIDKVGGLVAGKPVTDEGPTAELPHVEEGPAESEKLTTEELEITTADTQPLPIAEQAWEDPAYKVAVAAQFSQGRSIDKPRDNQAMDSSSKVLPNEASQDSDEQLLDLGDIGQSSDTYTDDFVLDIDLDLDESQQAPALWATSSSGTHAFVEPQLSQPGVVGWDLKSEDASTTRDKSAATQERTRRVADGKSHGRRSEVKEARLERVMDEPGENKRAARSSGKIGGDQLSAEAIDAIARRVVEHLSERVVQEIAWEVVPQLAELLIKRKLEEQESQPK